MSANKIAAAFDTTRQGARILAALAASDEPLTAAHLHDIIGSQASTPGASVRQVIHAMRRNPALQGVTIRAKRHVGYYLAEGREKIRAAAE